MTSTYHKYLFGYLNKTFFVEVKVHNQIKLLQRDIEVVFAIICVIIILYLLFFYRFIQSDNFILESRLL